MPGWRRCRRTRDRPHHAFLVKGVVEEAKTILVGQRGAQSVRAAQLYRDAETGAANEARDVALRDPVQVLVVLDANHSAEARSADTSARPLPEPKSTKVRPAGSCGSARMMRLKTASWIGS